MYQKNMSWSQKCYNPVLFVVLLISIARQEIGNMNNRHIREYKDHITSYFGNHVLPSFSGPQHSDTSDKMKKKNEKDM